MKAYRSRGARLTAALTGVHKAPAERMDEDHKELLRQTRRIHTLEAKRRQLKREVAKITKELRARRRGLKLFTIAMALRTSSAAREEMLIEEQATPTKVVKNDAGLAPILDGLARAGSPIGKMIRSTKV